MDADGCRRIAVVTGSRAEFGLLRPLMRAIRKYRDLKLQTIVTGTHLLPPHRTMDEVASEFSVDATVEMQRPGETGRFADARAMGRGVIGIAEHLERLKPDVVVVLGDRIEAFAGAAAGSIAGIRVAHIHGGDRAEGIADESIRHAVTKLAHIHFVATARSAERVIAMGEEPRTVHLVGSPALDDLPGFPPLTDVAYTALGSPEIVVLLHPLGRGERVEHDIARGILSACMDAGRVLVLDPNFDPGREGIVKAIESLKCPRRTHLPRAQFIGLLKRVRLIVGNSSAGLIECAALRLPCVNVGSRQAGRERAGNVFDVEDDRDDSAVAKAVLKALNSPRSTGRHPYGEGRSGERMASILASFEPAAHPLNKRISY